MTHEQIEELLGAYALDATEPGETREIEAHLAECPRCRAEIAAHLEMAALLGSASVEAPAGLWDKIASSVAQDRPRPSTGPPAPALPPNVVPLGVHGRGDGPRSNRRWAAWGALAAVAAAVVAVLGVEVGQLHSQVERLQKTVAQGNLGLLATEASAAPHQTIKLLADRRPAATVIVTRSGDAYWLSSSMRNLPASETYQLWGLARGKPVSLGLVGPHPDAIDFFKLEPDISELLITAEPEGGTTGPTTAVLAQGAVPPSTVS